MKATIAEQNLLQELAKIDAELGRLRHAADNLPVVDEITRAQSDSATVGTQLTRLIARRDELAKDMRGHEVEAERLTTIAEEKQERLDAGTGMDSRQLLALQKEIDHHLAAAEEAENLQLEAMEAHESISADIERGEAKAAELTATLTELIKRKESELGELTSQMEDATAKRTATTAQISKPLTDAYEEARARTGSGIVLMLPDGTVDGGMDLSMTEIDQVRTMAEDEVFINEDTGALIIRQR
ncbi:MAG: hypothetical protein Q4P33_07195 [Flaviflexus sp.]|nr:hypothetical protein [Flaviflexus sp.]